MMGTVKHTCLTYMSLLFVQACQTYCQESGGALQVHNVYLYDQVNKHH